MINMSAVLRVFAPDVERPSLQQGELFYKLRKERYPDEWWEMDESWDGLEDIVEDYNIDVASVSDPLDYRWDSYDTYISAFLDPRLNHFFMVVKERVLPDAMPGEMYKGSDGVKSARDITWAERMDVVKGQCRCCRSFDSYGEEWNKILVLEEDGEIVRAWTFGEIGVCAFSIEDDYGRITAWNGAQPMYPVDCGGFDWD